MRRLNSTKNTLGYKLNHERDKLNKDEKNEIRKEYNVFINEIWNLQQDIKGYKKEENEYKDKITDCVRRKGGGVTENRTVNKNIKCPSDKCKGYITKNQCSICQKHLCRRCLVVVDNMEELKRHECDKDTYETAQMIMNTSKPCPSCGTRISKVSGCDQMWCPQCDVAFSWITVRYISISYTSSSLIFIKVWIVYNSIHFHTCLP